MQINFYYINPFLDFTFKNDPVFLDFVYLPFWKEIRKSRCGIILLLILFLTQYGCRWCWATPACFFIWSIWKYKIKRKNNKYLFCNDRQFVYEKKIQQTTLNMNDTYSLMIITLDLRYNRRPTFVMKINLTDSTQQ